MKCQTETYVTLKPISERFSRISKEITDDDIRCLIKDELRKQLSKCIDFSGLQEIIEEFMEEQQDNIKGMLMESMKKRL